MIVMIFIGYVGRKRSNSVEGFNLAGGTIGGLLAGLSVFASWMSASTFMGVPAFFYQWGWPSFALAVSIVFAAPMAIILTLKKLRDMAHKMNVYTYTELVSVRFDSRFIRVLVILLSTILFISIMVAQLRAIGLIFQTTLGLEYWQSVILGVVVATLYILLGGMWASIVTDGIQAVIMIGTVLLLVPLGLHAVGGLDGLFQGLAQHGDSFVALTEPSTFSPVTLIFLPLYWGFVIFAYPYVMNRCLTLKGEKEYRNFALTFWASNGIGIFFIIVGGIALVLLPVGVQPDLASLTLATEILPSALGGIVMIGIFMAVMSSVDSVLHAAGSLVGNDLYRGVIAPLKGKDPDSQEVRNKSVKISKIFVVIFSIIPVYFAIFNPPEFLSLLLYWATGFMAAGTVAPLLIGLFWRKATKYSAIAAMLGGVVIYLALDLLPFFNFTSYVNAPIAVLFSGFIMVVVSGIENKFYHSPSLPKHAIAKLSVEETTDILGR